MKYLMIIVIGLLEFFKYMYLCLIILVILYNELMLNKDV